MSAFRLCYDYQYNEELYFRKARKIETKHLDRFVLPLNVPVLFVKEMTILVNQCIYLMYQCD